MGKGFSAAACKEKFDELNGVIIGGRDLKHGEDGLTNTTTGSKRLAITVPASGIAVSTRLSQINTT
jgi:hypothetical protein